jgi:hypothetical protein
MNENRFSSCERAEELVSVLYGEASEREARDFQLHLKQCGSCSEEFAAFANVRESIGEWRDEALSGFVSSPAVAALPARKSALAALRQFFDLSPLWLKGAVGFAAVVFCVLAALAVFRPKPEVPQVAAIDRDTVYTQADVDRAVQQALAKQAEQQLVPPQPKVVQPVSPSNSTVVKRAGRPEARRPFSRAEREQLAADLRLLSGDDDLDLELPADKNNPR